MGDVTTTQTTVSSGVATAYLVIAIIICILTIIAMWKIFDKAGEKGWKSIIPIYNTYIFFKITWGNGWFFLLMLIPFVNIVIYIITLWKLAKVFDKGVGFFIGLLLLETIFTLILGFGSAEYVGIQDNQTAA
ncbi:MAG: DUF5684 domain-containing protein [Eubacterium sp.]|nr:DUF5684 domain-containing protein [Eubacterium sp.]